MDVAGLGQEVPARILAVDAELNGVADRCRVVVAERFAFGEAELLADEIDARDLLRDRMLDLQTRVDLQERDRAVSSDEELAGAGAEVTHLAQDRLRRLDEDAVLLIGEERCGCFLHELLMTPLQRAVAGRDHDDSALGIREALGLNVPGPVEVLLEERIGTPSGWSDTALLRKGSARDFQGRDPTYTTRIARYGSSAALVGPLEDMVRFDRALMSGKLLTPEARASLWDSDPALGFMALGVWSYPAGLNGCAAPVHLVERRGDFGGTQVRNVIAPSLGRAVVLFTNDASAEFGEVWQAKGLTYDLLSAAFCPDPANLRED